MEQLFTQIKQNLTYEDIEDLLESAKQNSSIVANIRRTNRKDIFENTVLKQSNLDAAIQDVHILHWADGLAYHVWRSISYFHACTLDEAVHKPNETLTEQINAVEL